MARQSPAIVVLRDRNFNRSAINFLALVRIVLCGRRCNNAQPPINAVAMTHSTPPTRSSAPVFSRRELLAGAASLTALGASAAAGAQSLPELPLSSKELWQWVRVQPVIEPLIAYLDSAVGAPTWRLSMANEYRAREIQSNQIASLSRGERWVQESKRIAARVASFCGGEADEIVFTHGAGEALGMVANGLDLSAGDEVITTTLEHPAALSPWLVLARRRGIVVKQIELPSPLTGSEQAVGLFAGAVTDRTRVLCFSHISYADGAVLPVKSLCQFARQRNLTTVVDGAQALGMIEINVRDLDCDFYATSFHKWLGGSHGAGMLYVRREMLDRLWPIAPRGLDASPPIAFPVHSLANDDVPAALHKLGNAVPTLWPALRGAEAAMDLQQHINRARIEARIRELAIYARLRMQQLPGVELLTPATPGLWAGILTARFAHRSARDLATALQRNQRIFVSPIDWPGTDNGAVRISLHIFNTHEEIERLVEGLRQQLPRA
jgi:isopenicillin-N epimerase